MYVCELSRKHVIPYVPLSSVFVLFPLMCNVVFGSPVARQLLDLTYFEFTSVEQKVVRCCDLGLTSL